MSSQKRHTLLATGQDLGSIEADGEVRKIVILILELAEIILGLEERLSDVSNQIMAVGSKSKRTFKIAKRAWQ